MTDAAKQHKSRRNRLRNPQTGQKLSHPARVAEVVALPDFAGLFEPFRKSEAVYSADEIRLMIQRYEEQMKERATEPRTRSLGPSWTNGLELEVHQHLGVDFKGFSLGDCCDVCNESLNYPLCSQGVIKKCTAPAVFLGCGSRFSGSLSGVKPYMDSYQSFSSSKIRRSPIRFTPSYSGSSFTVI
ncbi:hypothetical protein L596_005191 [Steinernema carpocapsae]|uniref:Uncharacterized protein n=1 Tax=Steinernema carpocapsae TaxID=34508 RepID=A0A4U8UYG4_STECR|nr:hypothetical protein L596_005191 [Steinernema carpocapsae]